jgi:hypothetical protein
MSAEDLTTWAGVSVQQDLALVSLLGLTHVERNGHHFIDGMSFAPEAEQRAFVAAIPTSTPRRMDRRGCASRAALALGSLDRPGFAVGGRDEFSAMRPMRSAPRGIIGRKRRAHDRGPCSGESPGSPSSLRPAGVQR